MSYEDLIRKAVHDAAIDLVRDYRGDGLTGLDLAKNGAILHIFGKPGFAIKIEKLGPTNE